MPATSRSPGRALARAAIALVMTVAACRGDSPTQSTPAPDVVGTFTLTQVDARALPAVIYEGIYIDPSDDGFHTVRTYVDEGSLTIRADGSYEQQVVLRETVDGRRSGGMRWNDAGRYVHRADAGALHFESARWVNTTYAATIAGAGVLAIPQNLVAQETGSHAATFGYQRTEE